MRRALWLELVILTVVPPSVELSAGWLRPAVLGDASDASGSDTIRLYSNCSQGFLRHYMLYQFDDELLDQQYDDVKEKLLRFSFDQPLSQEKKIEFWKSCDGMIELSGQLLPVLTSVGSSHQ